MVSLINGVQRCAYHRGSLHSSYMAPGKSEPIAGCFCPHFQTRKGKTYLSYEKQRGGGIKQPNFYLGY